MKSSKYLDVLCKSKSIYNDVIIKTRSIQLTNADEVSIFNELLCTNISLNDRKNIKQILPFKHIKQYIEICFVEHLVALNRSQDSIAAGDASSDYKKYDYLLDSLLNGLEIWIDKLEKMFHDKPYSCINCGLRFNSFNDQKHQCRILNLMSHLCPCGDVFKDHKLYMKHIQPTYTEYSGSKKVSVLPFPKCKWAALHNLLIWLKTVCHPKVDTKETKINCGICKNSYTNYISWLVDYARCIESDMLTCQVCADFIGGLSEDQFPGLKSIFIPISQLKSTEVNLKLISRFFVVSKINKNTCMQDLMCIIGFDNIFHFELNKLLRNSVNPDEIRQYEVAFYQHRIQQLCNFFLDFPDVCSKCYSRQSISSGFGNKAIKLGGTDALLRSQKKHRCRGLKPEEHICVCTARFCNHESYVFHRLYRCQFLLFFHVCLFVVPNRMTILHSMCNKTCRPIHDLVGLRNHWKTCEDCHMTWIDSCNFCSDKYKHDVVHNSSSGFNDYFKRLLKAKDTVILSETKAEHNAERELKNSELNLSPDELSFYDTKLFCLKSGPPFNLMSVNKQKGGILLKRKRVRLVSSADDISDDNKKAINSDESENNYVLSDEEL